MSPYYIEICVPHTQKISWYDKTLRLISSAPLNITKPVSHTKIDSGTVFFFKQIGLWALFHLTPLLSSFYPLSCLDYLEKVWWCTKTWHSTFTAEQRAVCPNTSTQTVTLTSREVAKKFENKKALSAATAG